MTTLPLVADATPATLTTYGKRQRSIHDGEARRVFREEDVPRQRLAF